MSTQRRKKARFDLLLTIHKEHIDTMINSNKRFEFRRRKPRKLIRTMYLYDTSSKLVVAKCNVVDCISLPLGRLWLITRDRAGVKKRKFYEYFENLEVGHAIQIINAYRYKRPFCPIKRFGKKPQRSFRYL